MTMRSKVARANSGCRTGHLIPAILTVRCSLNGFYQTTTMKVVGAFSGISNPCRCRETAEIRINTMAAFIPTALSLSNGHSECVLSDSDESLPSLSSLST
jgi:hypothetical protein